MWARTKPLLSLLPSFFLLCLPILGKVTWRQLIGAHLCKPSQQTDLSCNWEKNHQMIKNECLQNKKGTKNTMNVLREVWLWFTVILIAHYECICMFIDHGLWFTRKTTISQEGAISISVLINLLMVWRAVPSGQSVKCCWFACVRSSTWLVLIHLSAVTVTQEDPHTLCGPLGLPLQLQKPRRPLTIWASWLWRRTGGI